MKHAIFLLYLSIVAPALAEDSVDLTVLAMSPDASKQVFRYKAPTSWASIPTQLVQASEIIFDNAKGEFRKCKFPMDSDEVAKFFARAERAQPKVPEWLAYEK